MNNLNRKLILIATTALAFTASTGFLLQTDAYGKLKINYNLLSKENQTNKKHINEQSLTIQQLGEAIKIKDDSIVVLNLRIDELVKETNVLKGKIKSLDQKVQQMSNKVNELTQQVGSLEVTKKSDQQKIKNLVAERDELLKQMEMLDKERMQEKQRLEANNAIVIQQNKELKKLEAVVKEEKATMKQLNESPVKETVEPAYAAPTPSINASIEDEKEEIIASRKQMRMREIVVATNIDFKSISIRDEKDGKDLDKIKNEGWRYTVINFDLTNPKPDAIFDEEFILQIFDTDNQRVVPFNESNPEFPDSNLGATGYKFTYEGKPLEIAYFNSQKKTSKNYEVRLYYAGKGFLLPLKNGTSRIVEDGNVVQR